MELVDVDLRWGITEKEAQQGKVRWTFRTIILCALMPEQHSKVGIGCIDTFALNKSEQSSKR